MGVREAGQGLGGGVQGLRFRGGRGSNVCRIFVVSYKKKKNGVFLKDALWGGGGYPPELAWWTGG